MFLLVFLKMLYTCISTVTYLLFLVFFLRPQKQDFLSPFLVSLLPYLRSRFLLLSFLLPSLLFYTCVTRAHCLFLFLCYIHILALASPNMKYIFLQDFYLFLILALLCSLYYPKKPEQNHFFYTYQAFFAFRLKIYLSLCSFPLL